MSVDDAVIRDPRITHLSKLVGWSRRETLGCLIEVWAICYDRIDCSLGHALIDLVAQREGFSQLMIEAELASITPGGKVKIAGAKARIAYLENLKQHAREGGLKSAELRTKEIKSRSNGAVNGTINLPVPDPVLVPDPVPDLKEPPIAPLKIPDRPRGRPRKVKPSEPTERELAVVRVVLGKLGSASGVAYRGSREHVRLITSRLRDGVSEIELRQVIGYCADKLGWENHPRMAAYLRPETLFGPDAIARYLDPARAWYAQLGPDYALKPEAIAP